MNTLRWQAMNMKGEGRVEKIALFHQSDDMFRLAVHMNYGTNRFFAPKNRKG